LKGCRIETEAVALRWQFGIWLTVERGQSALGWGTSALCSTSTPKIVNGYLTCRCSTDIEIVTTSRYHSTFFLLLSSVLLSSRPLPTTDVLLSTRTPGVLVLATSSSTKLRSTIWYSLVGWSTYTRTWCCTNSVRPFHPVDTLQL
jgi:hypothetical protein